MIRAAILGMTLSAGAASAQGMVPTGSLTRLCGGEVLSLAAATPVTPEALEQARDVVSKRVAGRYSALFDYAEVTGDQITVSMPLGIGDVAAIAPLFERVDFGFFPVVRRIDADLAVELVDGQVIMPDQTYADIAYVLQDAAILDGSAIAEAEPMIDQNGAMAVSFLFHPDAAEVFAAYTTAHIGEPFAIVLDGQVLSTPVVREPILGGRGMISGAFTEEDARDLASVLQGGVLPFDLVITARETLDGSDPSADFCP